MLYITSLWFIYIITRGLYLLIPFTYFVPLPSGNHPFVLCIYESVSVSTSLFLWAFVSFLRVLPNLEQRDLRNELIFLITASYR